MCSGLPFDSGFASPFIVSYTMPVSTAAAKLLSQFDGLPNEDKQEFLGELIRRLPRWDAGPLDDDVIAAAGDDLASMLDEEERGSEAR